jgi:hypothetical protein
MVLAFKFDCYCYFRANYLVQVEIFGYADEDCYGFTMR